MHPTEPIYLRRDCDALLIPSGQSIFLPKGTAVSIQQSLGGTYTVNTGGNLVRIDDRDADALGLESTGATGAMTPAQACDDAPVDHQEIRRQLRTCYDPEIPVNILDLGLIYSCHISRHRSGGHQVKVQMTLTAPGCGMGAVLAADVKEKLLRVRSVRSVDVQLVFDPPWNASRMSEAAKLQLGLL
ncbi:MAG: putative Fe-S cluster assembly protein SufT [Motiliproteus sp.]